MTKYSEMAKIAKDKMLLKEYEQKDDSVCYRKPCVVYLEDGDEFQIQLFNPTSRVVGAQIEFNGESSWSSSNKYIVLRPGERVWLERYLDSPRKFKFGTYSVSNTKEVKEAIKDNGLLKVKFYYEEKRPCYDNTVITCSEPHVFYDAPMYSTCYSSTVGNTTAGSTVLGCCDTLSLTSGYSASASTISANISTPHSNLEKTRCSRSMSKSIETGRVEEGSYSGQNFVNAYYDFSSYPFFTKEIQIMPMSRKQYNKNDLRKVYCTNCGKKLSTKYKFCPACGTKVNY